jgi:hypothetical protein
MPLARQVIPGGHQVVDVCLRQFLPAFLVGILYCENIGPDASVLSKDLIKDRVCPCAGPHYM